MIKIIIRPNTDGVPSNMVLGGSYQSSPGRLRVLVSENSFVEINESDKDIPVAMNITFSQRAPEHSFMYDPHATSDVGMMKRDVVEKFFGEHPLLSRNGKPTTFTKSAMYDMFSEQEKSSIGFEVWKRTLSVMKRVEEMSINELADVWYYYGIEPSGKKTGDLMIRLADPVNGLAVNDNNKEDKTNNFLKMFFGETKSETTFIVNTRKCLLNGIFTDKTDGGRSNYYHGTTFIGTSFNDLVSYVKREERIYKEHILPRLEEIDSITSGSDDTLSSAFVPKAKDPVKAKPSAPGLKA